MSPTAAPQTDMFGNKIVNTNWAVPQQQKAASKAPGNWLERALPGIGGVLGSIAGSATDEFTGPLGTIGGGAAGSSFGQFLENKLTHQGSGSNVVKEGLIGGAGALGGELAAPVLSGAGDAISGLASKLTGSAADEATQAGAQELPEGISDAAKSAATDDAEKNLTPSAIQKPGQSLIKSELGLDTLANPAEGDRLTAKALAGADDGGYGLTGNSKSMLSQLNQRMGDVGEGYGQVLGADTTRLPLEDVNDGIDKAIQGSKAYGATTDDGRAAMDKIGQGLKESAAYTADGDGTIGKTDLENMRQMAGTSYDTSQDPLGHVKVAAGQAAYSGDGGIRDMLTQDNPALDNMLKDMGDMHTVQDSLTNQVTNGSSGGMGGRARFRVGAAGVPVPINGILDATKGAIGTAIGGEGLTQAVAPEIGQAVAGSVAGGVTNARNQAAQQQAQQQLQGNNSLTTPSQGIQQALQPFLSGNTNGISSSLPSPDRIKQGMLAALATGDTSAYTALSQLDQLATSQQTQTELPSTAVKTVSDYQTGLGALQSLAQQFSSGSTNFNDLSNSLTESSTSLAKLAGVSQKQITSLLPNPTDNAETALQKLSAVKQLIDTNTEDSLTSAISSAQSNANAGSNQQDLLNSLLGGQGNSSLPSIAAMPLPSVLGGS